MQFGHTHAVAAAQQETVSLANVLSSRQAAHTEHAHRLEDAQATLRSEAEAARLEKERVADLLRDERRWTEAQASSTAAAAEALMSAASGMQHT